MRAELMVLGKPVDLSQRSHRRVLVLCIYATLLLLICALVWLSQISPAWRIGGVYIVFFALLLNRFLLGGYARGGLIRSFTNQEPRPATPPPYIPLGLYLRLSNISDRDWQNDERELQLRDHAHYQAYQAIAVLLAVLWLVSGWSASTSSMLAWLHVPIQAALSTLALSAVLLAITLPQAILLWTEPDMPEPDMTDLRPEE
jgi:hypothetical protein